MFALIAASGAVLTLAGLYAWLLLVPGPAPVRESFNGVAYPIGGSWVYRRSATTEAPVATVVAVHGFLQSPAYFLDLYAGRDDIEVVLIGACDYHKAFDAHSEQRPYRRRTLAQRPATIAEDASVLRWVLRHGISSADVRVHGHSRGSAVVIEAARSEPSLFRGVRVILETPVLPNAALFRPLPRGFSAAVPLLLPAWRRRPINAHNRPALGRLTDGRKRELLARMPFNASRALTLIRNLRDIQAWMNNRPCHDLNYLSEAVVVIADKDRILDPVSMQRSLGNAGGRLRVERVRGVSHFVSLDRPEATRRLVLD